MEKSMKKQAIWKHTGGGCGIGLDIGLNAEYCCDDDYENQITKEVVTLYSTMTAHCKMPSESNDLLELLALPGVKQLKTN
jgi:hypothetical protein